MQEPPEDLPPDFDQAAILVVDDDRITRQVTVHMLKILSANIRISEAENGRVALESLDEIVPDIIILDLLMPEMDGRTLLRHLRSNDTTRMTPVAVLTAFGDENRKRDLTLLGCEAFLHKPVKSMELIAVMHALMRTRRLYQKLAAEAKEAQAKYSGLVRLLHSLIGEKATNHLVRKNAIALATRGKPDSSP